MKVKSLLNGVMVAVLSLILPAVVIGPAEANPKKINKVFGNNDADGDGKLSVDEWPRSADVFHQIDADGDGYMTKGEFKDFLTGGGPKNASSKKTPKGKKDQKGAMPQGPQLAGMVGYGDIDDGTKAAFRAGYGEAIAVERGLQESSLIPVYPDAVDCPEIDHIFGEPWRGPVAGRVHSGADIPAPYDEPIYAMADGQVVAKYGLHDGGKHRGHEVILRHTPEQTGLPVYLYTLYSHFTTASKVEVGDHVKRGDYLGPNGKTGVPGRNRGPHIHLSIYYSDKPAYTVTSKAVMALEGHFMDPVALFQGGKAPLRSKELRLLPDDQKRVAIAYKTPDGKVFPSGAKIIWPFACD